MAWCRSVWEQKSTTNTQARGRLLKEPEESRTTCTQVLEVHKAHQFIPSQPDEFSTEFEAFLNLLNQGWGTSDLQAILGLPSGSHLTCKSIFSKPHPPAHQLTLMGARTRLHPALACVILFPAANKVTQPRQQDLVPAHQMISIGLLISVCRPCLQPAWRVAQLPPP